MKNTLESHELSQTYKLLEVHAAFFSKQIKQ